MARLVGMLWTSSNPQLASEVVGLGVGLLVGQLDGLVVGLGVGLGVGGGAPSFIKRYHKV